MTISMHEPNADVIGDMMDISLWQAIPESSLDEVIDESWTGFVPYNGALLREIRRTLRDGGVLRAEYTKSTEIEGFEWKCSENNWSEWVKI